VGSISTKAAAAAAAARMQRRGCELMCRM
jgi:hypothetical protein